MDRTPIETPLGQGTLFANKGTLRHIGLPLRAINGVSFNCSILGLNALPGPDPAAALPDVIARAMPRFADLPQIHANAMALLADKGWPDDVPFPNAWAQFLAEPKDQRRALRRDYCFEVLYYAQGPHLCFGLTDAGALVPLFDDAVFEMARTNALAAARLARLPQLNHATFGTFKPAVLQTLCHKTLNKKRVAIDLYLPEGALDRMAGADLDPFVPLHKDLRGKIGPVLDAALPLGVEWLADWLSPENAALTGPLLQTYPEARDGAIADTTLRAGLRLSRLCLAPYGTGTDIGSPCATWDLHPLPKGTDDQIFAVTTAPDGTPLSAALES